MYKLTAYNIVLRIADEAFIPKDDRNSDYQDYLAWVAAGNTPEPVDPEPVLIPQSVSMRQGREALIRRGYIATVDAHIAGMPGVEGDIARNEWDKSQVIERTRPLTLQMGQLLGLDDPGLDELFVFAATL